MKMIKKTYTAPEAQTYTIQPTTLLAASLGGGIQKDDTVSEQPQLGNRKEGWQADSWNGTEE